MLKDRWTQPPVQSVVVSIYASCSFFPLLLLIASNESVLMSDEYLCETHIHKYGESYENDEEEHWHGCTDADCPDYDGSIVGGAHVYDNDGGCAVCGYGTYLVGDVNEDGYIDNLDAAMILKYDAGIIDLDSFKRTLADANGDGYADNLDAAMILKYDAGIIDEIG